MKSQNLFVAAVVLSSLFISACDNSANAEAKQESKASTSSESRDKATNVLGGKATIVLPDGYVKMPQDILETKYPNEPRPQEAWYVESEGGKVSIAVSLTKSPLEASQIPEMAKVMVAQFIDFSPKYTEVNINGKKMGQIEMTTPAEDDTSIYNLMQLSSLDGKLMIITFNVTEDLKGKYMKEGATTLSTLRY